MTSVVWPLLEYSFVAVSFKRAGIEFTFFCWLALIIGC